MEARSSGIGLCVGRAVGNCPSVHAGPNGAKLEDAYLDGALSEACELHRSAYTCPLRTYGRRGGNPISGGGHQ
jgi:hypothetical protein